MLDTTQESQNELGEFNQEQWDQFLAKKKKEDLEAVKEQSKENKKENIEILEKHFHDRTLQPMSEFKKVGEKEAGCSSGFQAEHEYGESDKATFMIKSVLNHTLTEKEKCSRLAQFKKSFYEGSRKATKLENPYFSDDEVNNLINPFWWLIESNICYDDLNIADFIREYVAGDLYKLFLHDRAPIVELVTNNDLPEKRFVKNEAQSSESHEKYEKGEYKFQDQSKECIEQEKSQDKLHLRSKFLDKFITLMDPKEKGKNYQDAKGFEKILAAQILLGEADIMQLENFGIIEKEYENAKGEKVKEKLWAKIDHGRSLYSCVNHWNQILLCDFKTLCGIEVDYKGLALELSSYVKTISENEELINGLIDKKASNLNQLLNSEMQFTLKYISSNNPAIFCKEVFSYSSKSKEFVSDKGNSLGGYFKQRLKSQVQTMREYSEISHVISAISNDFEDIINVSREFFVSQCKNPLIWAIKTGKKLDGKDPIIWAVDNGKKLDGRNPIIWAIETGKKLDDKAPIIWAIETGKKLDDKDPIIWAVETGKKLDDKAPIIWAIETGKKIDDKDPIIWAADTGKKIDGRNPIIWAIDTGEKIEGKKPGKCAAEHGFLINGKNPETFASKVQLVKFVNKASLPIVGLAIVACTGFIIANLSMALIISAAAVALIAALIVKPIASHVQRDLLQNSTVSTSLNNPSVGGFQRELQLA
ncbi:hypothetical protein Wcon_00439 [Wolbachia endosymbiont of Cylisticus convexus]|uniref:hypothetical protein n=1 Tax=Wolbachia endosymbiont of Cylisticus convexus TaxID=118728 RepID=UPI000E19638E|nr:hypothetical protein [Wolbachia endosymbiont of Cylisticus convexus]RDD35374.1 hypothetical protein Wcon_00439 [Wolbachia endosymbiont of Cylisticus convexus]